MLFHLLSSFNLSPSTKPSSSTTTNTTFCNLSLTAATSSSCSVDNTLFFLLLPPQFVAAASPSFLNVQWWRPYFLRVYFDIDFVFDDIHHDHLVVALLMLFLLKLSLAGTRVEDGPACSWPPLPRSYRSCLLFLALAYSIIFTVVGLFCFLV